MGAWDGCGNFDTNVHNTAATTDVIVIIRLPRIYRASPSPAANVIVPSRRSKAEEREDDPVQAAKARLRRQHRIAMIEVGRELRLSRERLLHADRLLAFTLEQPPPNRVRERLSPGPRAPPETGPPRAAR